MTDKEILEFDILIAVFMQEDRIYGVLETGGNPLKAYFMFTEINKALKKGYSLQLPYHHSWEALMPALKAFNDLFIHDEFIKYHWTKATKIGNRYASLCDNNDESVTRRYEIKDAFKALVQSIKWYNNQQK